MTWRIALAALGWSVVIGGITWALLVWLQPFGGAL